MKYFDLLAKAWAQTPGLIAVCILLGVSPAYADYTYTLSLDSVDTTIADTITASMEEAAGLYNKYGSFNTSVYVYYDSGVSTAQASYGGPITFGGSRNTRVAMHEMLHTVGVGTYWNYWDVMVDGVWEGEYANALLEKFDGDGSVLKGDTAHIWPYGLNYDSEDSTIGRIRHIMMMAAVQADMGILSYTQEPPSQVAAPGSTAVISAAAYGASEYAWYRVGDSTALSDGGDISGAATSSLHIANIEQDDEGYYYCVASGLTSRPAHLMTRRFVSRLAFDGDAADSISSHDGTETGSPSYTAGVIGQALAFDGSDDAVTLPEGVADAENFTVATWVYWDGGDNWQRIFDFGCNTGQYIFLTPSNGSNMRLVFKNALYADGEDEQIVSANELTSGAWVHLAATLDGSTATIYVNGAATASNDAITISPIDFRPDVNYIGGSQYSADPLFDGSIDDFRFYNYALSADAIEALYENTGANIAPSFNADPLEKDSVMAGSSVEGTLSGDAGDPDEDAVLTFSKTSGPSWLTVADNGALSGRPANGDVGVNTFAVRVEDEEGAYDTAMMTIEVTAGGAIAWWRFEDGTAGEDIPGTSYFTAYQAGVSDESGNGNHLCDYWDNGEGSSIAFSANIPPVVAGANTLSGLSEGGNYPSMFTWSDESNPSGVDLETASLGAWTLEAFIYPTAISGNNRGIIGRDGIRPSSSSSPLYFNIQDSGELRCEYFDEAQEAHAVQSAVTLSTANWYYVAATCDGSTLKLWLADLTGGETSATLVDSEDVSTSSDPDFGPWPDGGQANWSVFRGYWESGDVDRFLGAIDEVRISNIALDINTSGLLATGLTQETTGVDAAAWTLYR